jgi:hypothetical protein
MAGEDGRAGRSRLTTTALASLYLQGTNVPFIADKTEGGTIVCDDRKYA